MWFPEETKAMTAVDRTTETMSPTMSHASRLRVDFSPSATLIPPLDA